MAYTQEQLRALAERAAASNQKAVEQYRKGKQNAIQALAGQCMGMTNGLANPALLLGILHELLDS